MINRLMKITVIPIKMTGSNNMHSNLLT